METKITYTLTKYWRTMWPGRHCWFLGVQSSDYISQALQMFTEHTKEEKQVGKHVKRLPWLRWQSIWLLTEGSPVRARQEAQTTSFWAQENKLRKKEFIGTRRTPLPPTKKKKPTISNTPIPLNTRQIKNNHFTTNFPLPNWNCPRQNAFPKLQKTTTKIPSVIPKRMSQLGMCTGPGSREIG